MKTAIRDYDCEDLFERYTVFLKRCFPAGGTPPPAAADLSSLTEVFVIKSFDVVT